MRQRSALGQTCRAVELLPRAVNAVFWDLILFPLDPDIRF